MREKVKWNWYYSSQSILTHLLDTSKVYLLKSFKKLLFTIKNFCLSMVKASLNDNKIYVTRIQLCVKESQISKNFRCPPSISRDPGETRVKNWI